MNITTVGVDPGTTGAFAILHGTTFVGVWDFPTAGGYIEVFEMITQVRELSGLEDPVDLAIEQVGGIQGQAAGASFKFGRATGQVIGAAQALGWHTHQYRPQVWKKKVGVPSAPSGLTPSKRKRHQKGEALRIARGLYPAAAEDLKRVKDADRAEAILIARAHTREMMHHAG